MNAFKIAIVPDWLTSQGGAERVVLSLVEAFPLADIFTSVWIPDRFPELQERRIFSSFLQKISTRHQFLVPLFPIAFKRFDLSEYDIIISSSSSGYSKCVQKTRKNQVHICYCHSPVRYLYHARDEYVRDYPLPWWAKMGKFLLPSLLKYLEYEDLRASKNVDFFIANSRFVADRILKYYGRESEVIYPGVKTQPFFQASLNFLEKKDYFLALGRFIPYKKFDLLVEAFAANKFPLKLAGVGPEWEKCKDLARRLGATNIEFLGFVDEKDIPRLYAEARAFLFPMEEDFGLTPVEAMSAGTPVIYYNRGGAVESVDEGSGVFFDQQTAVSLNHALERFLSSESSFDRQKIIANGRRFDESFFREKMIRFVEEHCKKF